MERNKHVTGIGYLATYIALMVLATVSLLLSFVHWTTGDLIISMVIASIKSILVFWFFMHLVEQRFANRLVVLVSFALLTILITLTATDVVSRRTFPPAPRPSEASEEYRR
jgi:cytochrome c oxidase subunit IV